jgi:hypothetical protein
MSRLHALFLTALVFVGVAASERAHAQSQPQPAEQSLELATIRPRTQQGFSNAGWAYDRYSKLPTLDAKKRMVVADLEGPGVIRAIHTTRHASKELTARGIVLEIYFDDSPEPAVMSPLADFFGDGCNGGTMDFSTNFIECAPGSYNCYFPMPFHKKAKVVFRNDTDQNLSNYSFVEWEKLPEWKKEYGYFHATYARKCFQVGPKACETFLELSGSGQLIGRQFSVITDEPFFKNFDSVMEGNNEVDIDGKERLFDYLGTEDSFNFSWGFQKTFAGLRAGMPLVQPNGPSKLSIYRFHDHQPIRFDKSLKWSINWTNETGILNAAEKMNKIAAEGGCWVDYATVHYWYQDHPGGYQHKELESVPDRQKLILSPAKK